MYCCSVKPEEIHSSSHVPSDVDFFESSPTDLWDKAAETPVIFGYEDIKLIPDYIKKAVNEYAKILTYGLLINCYSQDVIIKLEDKD